MSRGHFLMTQISEENGIGQESFGFLIQTLAQTIDTRMKTELKAVGVDVRVFANLMMLGHKDGINQRQIGERLNFPEYFTSRNVDALEKAGYAERRPDPNSRRSYLVFLTDAGRAKAAELPVIGQRINDHVLSDLSAQERQQVVTLLQRIAGVHNPA